MTIHINEQKWFSAKCEECEWSTDVRPEDDVQDLRDEADDHEHDKAVVDFENPLVINEAYCFVCQWTGSQYYDDYEGAVNELQAHAEMYPSHAGNAMEEQLNAIASTLAYNKWDRSHGFGLYHSSQATIDKEIADARIEVDKWVALLSPVLAPKKE